LEKKPHQETGKHKAPPTSGSFTGTTLKEARRWSKRHDAEPQVVKAFTKQPLKLSVDINVWGLTLNENKV
jgi:hypothetical protein